MEVNSAFVIKLKPTAAQRKLLADHFGQTRFVYNHFLEERRKQYRENQLQSTYYGDSAKLTQLKKDFPWLRDTSAVAQQHTLKHLDDAYKGFFGQRAKFPKFKSKRGEQSFSQHAREIKLKDRALCIPKFQEGIRFTGKLMPFQRIRSVTVRKTVDGVYYAAICTVREVEQLPFSTAQTGIDLGLTDLAVFSTGKRIKAPKHFRRNQKRLKAAQQHLSRKVKGSKRREKQRIKVARIHRQIANARKDTLHKASAFAVKNHGVIAVETLSVANMLKNRSLALSISDAGWSEFVRQLEYKCAWYGRRLLKVGRFYPSSKSCYHCGWINQGLKLKDRQWTCQSCGKTLNRDTNASLNILKEGLKQSERQSSITGVEEGSDVVTTHLPVKRLAKTRQLVSPAKRIAVGK